jgi:hypothetical protein
MAGQMTERLSPELTGISERDFHAIKCPARLPNRKDLAMPFKSSWKAVKTLPETMQQASSLAILTLLVAIVALVVSVFGATVASHGA